MRKAYLLFTLLCITFAACKKNNNNKPTTYVVHGVHDIALTQGETYDYSLFLDYVGPVQENVTLEMLGLPSGVSVDFSRTGGVPSFTTDVTLRNNSAEPGMYECQLKTHGDQTGDKFYDFTINVKSAPICGLLGNYTYTSTCDTPVMGTAETLTAASVPVENAVNPVRFANFGAHGWIVSGKVDCSTNKITIDLQSVNTSGNVQVSGTGSFTSAGTITINYTIYTTVAGVTTQEACMFTMLRTN